MIKGKQMRLKSEQKQRYSDEKAIKGKCIAIIKGPNTKVWWSESDQRQRYDDE
jgi:hypothetical protein